MKTLLISSITSLLLVSTGIAFAQSQDHATVGAWRYNLATQHVEANGRCDGISYGTGARRCGTLTGGPSGGLSGRD